MGVLFCPILSPLSEDDKKALCTLLGKLYIPDEVDDDKIRTLKLLMANLRVVRLAQRMLHFSAETYRSH